MYIARIGVTLTKLEMDVLVRMSEADCRPPREQMRFLLREEAKRRGLLDADASSEPLSLAETDALSEEAHNG